MLLPAVLAEDHEAAVHRDLGHVALDRPPLAVDRVAGDVDPGRDRLVGHEHLRDERLELAALLLGVASSGGSQKLGLPASFIASRIASRTDAGIAVS